jgi:Ca2+-binding RTX toxin-like protein
MRLGKGRITLTGCVAVAAAGMLTASAARSSAGPSAQGRGDAHTTALSQGQRPGAQAADSLTIFTIDGTAFPGRINAFIAPTGRLTLLSPEGINAPASPNGECAQDSPTQVSCIPGFVDVLAGDLKGGADTFTTAASLTTLVGATLVGPDSPLAGGSGRDRIIGGASSDLIEGGGGPDSLSGNGSSDLLRGGSGKDELSGGPFADALFGGGGSDDLDGGEGRDLCSGGGGRDRATDCTGVKKIP